MLIEHGRHDEAEALRQGELAFRVATARAPSESDADVADRLEAIMTHEAERVASAAVLAELLLPILTRQMSTPAAPVSNGSTPAPRLIPVPTPVARPAASIADFIDMMIAQETAPSPSALSPQRRAS